MKRILFALEWLPDYRRGLLSGIRDEMQDRGVEVSLVMGQAPASKAARNTDSSLPWATYRENTNRRLAGMRVCVQPISDLIREHDVVVVQQAAGLWANLLLATGVVKSKQGWAMWGHGQHFNPHEVSALTERLKGWETRRCDHFFAYTETSKKAVVEAGLDPSKVTVVNNTLPPANVGVAAPEIVRLAREIDERSKHVGIMVSSLDEWKQIPLLVEILQEIRREIPDFEFIVIGNGDHEGPLHELARSSPWLHMMGTQFAADKVCLADISKVMIHPGLVGLHIVDAFRLGCPMVTTNIDYHSHELDYLEDGVNGVIVHSTDARIVAAACVRILTDDAWRERLVAAGRESAEGLTLDAYIDRFCAGLDQMLQS